MTSRFSSKNKGKKAKRKNSVRKKRYKETENKAASPGVEPCLPARANLRLATT